MTPQEYKTHLESQVIEAQRSLAVLAQFEAAQRSIEALKKQIEVLEKKDG